MSLLRYAASGVLRNRRRTFSSILGVLLAITFIAGTFIAIDSSTRATLDATLNQLNGDYTYSATATTVSPPSTAVSNGSVLRDTLAAVPGIADVSVYRQASSFNGGIEVANPTDPNNTSSSLGQMMGIDPYHLPASLRNAAVSGSILLPNGTVVLDPQTANLIRVKVGDAILVEYHRWNGTGVVNYSASFTLGGTVEPSSPYGPIYYPGPYLGYGNLLAVNLRDLDWVLHRLNLTDNNAPQVQGEIWINRDRFIDPYDVAGSTFRLTRLGRQLSNTLLSAGYVGSVTDSISPTLQSFSMQIAVQRVEYLLLSFPVVLLGLYLGSVGVDLGHAERRRELGVMKTRGASKGQVAVLLIMESLLGGFVATVLGLLFGLVLSRFLIGVVTPFGTSASYSTLNLTPDTVIVVTILSAVFMGLASLRSARRTSSLPIIETLRYYAPGETRIHYTPVWDILLVSYAVLVYVAYWYLLSNPTGFFIFFLAFILILSIPLAPVFLIIGLTRLLTRSTGKVYEGMSRLLRPFAKNLEQVISRNLSRNPRRSSNIAIIIALGLAFGVFVTSTLASQQAVQEQGIRAGIGADLAAEAPYLGNATAIAAMGRNLTTVPGIAAVSHVSPVNAQVALSGSSLSPFVVALDPATYFSVASPPAFDFENPTTAAGAQSVVATTGDVLITGNLALHGALQVGDQLVLSVTAYQNYSSGTTSIQVTVGGIVRFLPGTGGSFYTLGTAPDVIYGSNATFAKLIAVQAGSGGFYRSDRFLISLKPGADWKTVQASVQALGFPVVESYQQQLDQLNSNPLYSSYLGFIQMEVAFIVVILTAGLALIIYAASLERRVEFAGITARGSSGWQTAGLLVGEAFVIMVIGVLLGVGVGLLTGFLSTSVSAPSFGGGESMVPSLFAIPTSGLLLVVLAPVAMIGTSVLVSWRIARMNVARVLKMRGG